jgi:hypothetical protein
LKIHDPDHYSNDRNTRNDMHGSSERLLVLLHIFAKRSTKINQRDIRIAQERWEDFRHVWFEFATDGEPERELVAL